MLKKAAAIGISMCLFIGALSTGRVLASGGEETKEPALEEENTDTQGEEGKETNKETKDEKDTEAKDEDGEEALEEEAPPALGVLKEEEEERKANSWRYKDGERISAPEVLRASSPNAWKKVNGRYVNSRGEAIPGAQKKGIDVSEWQEDINWEQVKADGIEYAIIRCGFGAKGRGGRADYKWKRNVAECERLGIPYGVYLYSYASSESEASLEADHALELLRGHTPSYPVYFDMEDKEVLSAGVGNLGKMAQAFCGKLLAAGYKTGVYANLNWWDNYLTSPVFDNPSWSKWVAQYNYRCDYRGAYDMWQCTSKGSVRGINGNVDLNFLMIKTYDEPPVSVEDPELIRYSSHLQTYGWQPEVTNGCQSGMTGYGKRLEAFQIKVGEGYEDLKVNYRAHVQTYGWQNWVSDGETAGTTGEEKRVEAIEIKLAGAQAESYDVYYRVHAQTYGWLGWAKNGESAGTAGYAKRMEALQIAVLPKDGNAKLPGTNKEAFKEKPIGVDYSVYIERNGWQEEAHDGKTAGTTGKGKRLEGLKVRISGVRESGDVYYDAYMQGYGWTGEKKNMQEAGKPGGGKRLEAVKIRLTGELEGLYDIYYRAHAQGYGWLGWAKNGQSAGTIDHAKRLEAIEIKLVKKNDPAPGETKNPFKQARIKYDVHAQTYGWRSPSFDGETAGTTGEGKRLEAVKISLAGKKGLRYRTHVQTYGWKDWVSDGEPSGTTGLSKRLEAIEIKLTKAEAEDYDVYYRVHAQTYGWLGWAKNGESAGTAGLSKRLEAIEIRLVEKGEPAPGEDEEKKPAFIEGKKEKARRVS